MHLQKVLIAGLLASTLNCLFASDLSVVGEIRERLETLEGMNKKAYGNKPAVGKPDDTLLVSRLKLGFIYKASPDITYKAIAYYSSVYGWSLTHNDFKKVSGTQTYWLNPQEDLDFVDLNIEVKNLAGVNNLSTKIGRQANRYGDKRLLGPGSWGNSYGWLWDLVKISYKFDDNFIDAFYGQTKDKDKYKLSLFRKHVYAGAGIYSHFSTTKTGAIEPFIIHKNGLYTGIGNGQNTEKSFTFGLRAFDKDLFGFNYDLTYAKANGSIKSKDYDAYAYVAKLGYKFKKQKWQPNLVLGRVYASGDDNPNDNINKTFRTPFGGTDGSLYGRMDIMKWSNLVENLVELHLSPLQKMNLKLSYHDFSLAESKDRWTYYNKANINGNNEVALGQELDAEFKYNYIENLEFQVIYAYFYANDFIIKNVSNNNAQRVFLEVKYKFY